MKQSVLYFLFVFCALSLAAQGKDIYVSTSGNDSNAGTQASPYRNIQKGINSAVAGDVINVKAGTYVERLTFSSKSGTSGSPITLRSDPANAGTYPVVDCATIAPTTNNDLSAILTISNCSYVTVQGLELKNYVTSSTSAIPCGIRIQGSGTGVKILNNKVHHIWQSSTADANGFGLVVYGSSGTTPIDQLLIDGNEVYDLRTGSSESFTLNGNVTNFTVSHNSVHDGNNIGMDFIGFEGTASANDYARNGVVRDNVVYNIDTQYNPAYGGDFGGISDPDVRNSVRAAAGLYVDGGSFITMERNEVYNCNYGIEIASEHSGKYATNCIVRDNLVRLNHIGGIIMGGYAASKGGIQNCSFINNTLYKNDAANGGGGNIEVQHHVSTTVIKQNLIVCGTSTAFVQIDSSDNSFPAGSIDYNLYSGTSTGNADFKWAGSSKSGYSAWLSASGQDTHSSFVTASTGLFSKASPLVAADFALISTSPAKDKGSASFVAGTGETDFFHNARVAGTAVDIGMAEYGGLAPALSVQVPAGTAVAFGGTVSFGTVVVPNNVTKTFTLKNTGTSNLTGLTITKDGTNAAEYTVGSLSAAPPLAPGASVTFDVTFTPASEGTRTAALHIVSNDPTHATYNVVLSGVAQLTPSITTQPLAKTVSPGAAVTFTVVATGTKTLTYQWRKDTQNITGATAASYTIAHAAETDEGSYDVVVSNPAGSKASDAVDLSVNDPVTFAVPLAGQSAAVGSTITFTAAPSGTGPFTYQWRKNGVNIAGAIADSYVIPNVALTSSGLYSVVVKNIVGSVASANAMLSVVDAATKVYKLPVGGRATMPAAFAGTVTSYAWTKNSGLLPADSRYVGGATKTLTIYPLREVSPDDSGVYQCVGSCPSGDLVATAQLIVYGSAPLISVASVSLPTAIVGGAYAAPHVPYDLTQDRTPTVFGASGLPAGLKINAATGDISGTPLVALTADHDYPVKLTVGNAKGTVFINTKITVKPLPAGTVGTFTGAVTPQSAVGFTLGGRVDLTVAAAGSYSGKVTLGAVPYGFVGTLVTDLTGASKPHGTSIIKRAAPLPALTLTFDVDSSNRVLVNSTVTDGTTTAAFSAWRYGWVATTPAAELAALKTTSGYYTFGMTIPSAQDGVESIPQGMSYGSFTVAANGTLKVVGRMADNTPFICATFAGPHGEVLLYQALYAGKGSICGALQLTVGAAPTYADNSLSGSIKWLRPAIANVHIYKDGFGPLDLTAFGSRYIAPKAPAIVLGLTNNGVDPNARLSFAQGGVADTETPPDLDVRIVSGGGVVRPTTNPAYTTLVINPTTGGITGTFRLTDTNPAVPTGAKISRSSTYYGLIVKDSAGWLGGGYFLLAKRPQVLPQTIATTDVLSGFVKLEAK